MNIKKIGNQEKKGIYKQLVDSPLVSRGGGRGQREISQKPHQDGYTASLKNTKHICLVVTKSFATDKISYYYILLDRIYSSSFDSKSTLILYTLILLHVY